VLDLILVLAASYLIGSIPTGVIAGKLFRGVDIRERGSRNTGATNSFRVLGWKLGSLVALGDFLKGYVSVALVSRIALGDSSDLPRSVFFIAATLAAAVGHIIPVFAGFRGGKGFGTLAGAITAEYPILAPFCLAVFLGALALTGCVAVCAAAAALALPFFYLLAVRFFGLAYDPVVLAFFCTAFGLTVLGARKKLISYFRGEAELFENVMLFKPRKEKLMEGVIFDLSTKALDGSEHELGRYRGKALLVVNTASKCGFTPQYKGLEQLYQKYKDRGLVVLGFPCDQFGHQEPGGAEEIAAFCERNYGVTFPLMGKCEVNGKGEHPVFAFLKARRRGSIKWNFTKFLVARDGSTVRRFEPMTKPEKLEKDIEAIL
jgi:glutathione peroxidase